MNNLQLSHGLSATALIFLSILALSGCGGGRGSDSESASGGEKLTVEEKKALLQGAVYDEARTLYESKIALPPKVFEDLEAGRLTQEEVDRRAAEGEFEKFFVFKTIEDLPDGLEWEDGTELPELGSPDAKKGGTRYSTVQDFPRTLRTVGPDSNGSFRPMLLDDVTIPLAMRHPNVTDVGPTGFHHFPGLAKSWALDKPNKTVYVRLNENARWSDGVPITTDDMLFMFFFFTSEYIQAPWYNNAYNRFFTRMTVYDDHTFSIEQPEAKPDMKARVLDLRPVPAHFYAELGADFPERYQWRFTPTTGPYVIRSEDIKKGESIVFTRIDDWWARDLRNYRYRFNYDKINVQVVRDPNKAFEMFKNGELDMFSLTLPEFWHDKLPDSDPLVQRGLVHKAVFYNDVPRPPYGLWINRSKPILGNRDIRVGLQHATNWDLVIEKYFRGDYERLKHTAVGYGDFSHPDVGPREFSIEKALAAFARAGFDRRGTDGILVNDQGQRLSFTISAGAELYKDFLTILREEAAKAGVDYRINIMDGTASFKQTLEKQHEIVFMAWGYSPEMYPRYWETFHSVNARNPDGSVKTQTNNINVMDIPELDELIESYRGSSDANEMIRLARRMEEIIYEDAAFIPAFEIPFYRIAYWRWIKWPEGFDVKLSEAPGQYFMAWIDTEAKRETLPAVRGDKIFEKSVKIYDQYKN